MKFLKRFWENIDIEAEKPQDSVYYNGTQVQPDKKDRRNLIYDESWKSELPSFMTINYHNKYYKFKRGNVMLLGDTVQITYDYMGKEWGAPDTLEFDIYFVKDAATKKMRFSIDITYGDFVVCEFSIEPPSRVKLIQSTSYNSKFDPSNTPFGLSDDSLNKFVNFLNKFRDMELSKQDLKFLIV